MLKKTMLMMVFLILFSKVLGFGREIILSSLFGVSDITDAYYTGVLITTVVVGFVGLGINATFIPRYHSLEVPERNTYFATFFWIMLFFGVFISALVFAFSHQLVLLFAPGIEDVDLAVQFTRMMSLGILFSFVLYVAPEFNRANGDYISQQVSGIILNVGSILSVVLAFYYGHEFLAYGLIFVLFIRAVHSLHYVFKNGGELSKFDSRYLNVVFNMFKASPFMMIAISSSQIHYIIDRVILSDVSGAISRLSYSYSLNMLIFGIFTISVIHVFYSELSKSYSKLNIEDTYFYLSKAFKLTLLFITPIFVLVLMYSEEIVGVIYQRGKFGEQDTIETARYLLLYAPFLFCVVIRELLSKYLLVSQSYKRIYTECIVSILLNFFISRTFAAYGYADMVIITTSVVGLLSVIFFVSKIYKDYKIKVTFMQIVELCKILCPSLIFVIIPISNNSNIKFISILLCMSIVYVGFAYLINRDIFKSNLIRR